MTQKNENPALARGARQETSASEVPGTTAPAIGAQAVPPKLGLTANAASDDPFDLEKLRIPQDFLETTSVKKLLTTVPVRRPGPQEFFRIHPSLQYRSTLAFLELKDEREVYLVDLGSVPELQPECYIATLFTGITRSGVLFMWPVRVPAVGGRAPLDWHVSAATAAQAAMIRWTKMKSNMDLRAYEIFEAASNISEPTWSTLSFQEICRIAFKSRLINTPDHPVIKRLRGE